MTKLRTLMSGVALASATSLLAGAAFAQTAQDLMMTRLGTTEADPVLVEAFEKAAQPVTPEMRAKALECWKNNACETGTGGPLTVAYADGFGENVWRRVTAMEFVMQALTYPEVGKILYTSAGGDASKAIADLRSYIAQGVDVIVIFADHGEALAPTIREAKEAGITVVLHNGTVAGTPGEDYLTNISENICNLGTEFIKAVATGNPDAKTVVAFGGVPGNPLSATWQDCAEKELPNHAGMEIVAKPDTNWTQEGFFQAASAVIAQFEDIDGYISDYADGFRGAVRAYQQANKPMDVVVALRTDEQGLFCDWEAAANENFKIFYSSGQNYQSRFALTAALRAKAGQEVPATIDVPFSMKPVKAGMCNPDLPMETSVSTLVDADTLKAMFAQ